MVALSLDSKTLGQFTKGAAAGLGLEGRTERGGSKRQSRATKMNGLF